MTNICESKLHGISIINGGDCVSTFSDIEKSDNDNDKENKENNKIDNNSGPNFGSAIEQSRVANRISVAVPTLEVSAALQAIDDTCKARVRKIRSRQQHDLEKEKNLPTREKENANGDHLESCCKTSEEHESNDEDHINSLVTALEMTSLALQTTLERSVRKVGVDEYHRLIRSHDANARLYQVPRILSPKAAKNKSDSTEMEDDDIFESIGDDDSDSMSSSCWNDNDTDSICDIESSDNGDDEDEEIDLLDTEALLRARSLRNQLRESVLEVEKMRNDISQRATALVSQRLKLMKYSSADDEATRIRSDDVNIQGKECGFDEQKYEVDVCHALKELNVGNDTKDAIHGVTCVAEIGEPSLETDAAIDNMKKSLHKMNIILKTVDKDLPDGLDRFGTTIEIIDSHIDKFVHDEKEDGEMQFCYEPSNAIERAIISSGDMEPKTPAERSTCERSESSSTLSALQPEKRLELFLSR
mmetsp:Transcript_57195/g.66878  ORF Transcript_57195/g.66878 Transcript_57195/m.66878 type:complete len:474 (-) Transcript_57195:64-1485(-)|eukprot:CAMPEP_0194363106 /NCGR_PEP_ID=MMETSP0174-20130528/11020_1 /TAXON_ID=216777 /ORGANISM="Proboscia alata, Strain PI-D3" /LENGTH=473 /DNA_ID=CAMNT_0039136445 /DNA_START=212 /DNA_END=1633 /DNA_ORIENTATION=+